MKQFFLLLTLVYATESFATIRTVSNNPSTIAQFGTIQAAVDAAFSGDTVYVHGSPNNYAGFAINNKQLVVIGPGWSPNKTLPHRANITSLIFLNGAGTAGTELQGLSIFGSLNVTTLGVNDIRFVRNRFYRCSVNIFPTSVGVVSGYTFQGNWFEDGNVASSSQYAFENMLFQNNLFFNSGLIGSHVFGFTNAVNVLFDHNLFYGGSSGSRDVFGNNTRFITLSNNIFVRNNAVNNLSGANFYNNVTYLTGNDAPWTVNGNVDGGGNLAGTDPQLAAQTDVNNGVNNPLLDFSIATGPANNSGTDGKDRGLLYEALGSLNWTNSRSSRLPYIYSMQTNTPTVVPGGSVTVTVEARTSN